MFKKIVMVGLLSGLCLTNTLAQDINGSTMKGKKSNKFKIDELVILPHPGKLIKQGKVILSKEQQQRLKKEVKATIVPKYQQKMRDAFTLEKRLQRAVQKGKSKVELKDLIDEIAQLKREALDIRLDALNQIQQIVTKKQWQKINRLTYQ